MIQEITKRYGKGAIPTPQTIKDGHYRLLSAPALIDWSKPYIVPATLHQRDQKSSSSCTAQATGYYTETLSQIENKKDEQYSNRFVYSQTHGPDGGAYIWKAMTIPQKPGTASAASVPDGDSTETTMQDTSLNAKAVLEARADKYAMIPRVSIDQLAQLVIDYHGFVTGFNGWNGMFAQDGTIIDWSKNDWGHCVYVCGFEMRNGKKCLKFKNSWTAQWGDNGFGYFTEDFVNSGMMFDAYVYAVLADIDPQSIVLTEKQMKQLQALEGYHDQAGIDYWSGKTDGVKKTLDQYLAARLPNKLTEITNSLQ